MTITDIDGTIRFQGGRYGTGSKDAKAEHARIEALKKAGKWPPKEEKKQITEVVVMKDPFEGKTVVHNGVDVDRVMELTRQLMSETEPNAMHARV